MAVAPATPAHDVQRAPASAPDAREPLLVVE